ncbi:unnamed protein product [Peronospora belbahrii]|uniref:Uncharacterized protein n=1 Tax=Peronospora belbahrii TaxID=622444 RepID=A0ABN8D3N1_9STRA|nr:unnamed protein product [Peronospora belbahrii]
MANLQQDVEALDRVLFRLVSVDDERLIEVLQVLLPQLLSLFPCSLITPLEVELKDKILQVVSHIKTRLQALLRPTLPLDALCQVLQQTELSVFSYNLALHFLELGFNAASKEQQTKVLAAVVKTISRFSTVQQETFFRLLIRALPVTASTIFPSLKEVATEREEEEKQQEETLASAVVAHLDVVDDNVDVVLDFLLDLVLYELPSSMSANMMLFGLMTPRVERLQRVNVSDLNRETFYELQLHALKLVKEMAIPTKLKLPVYLAGSASFHHAVKAFSEEQLSRVIKYEEIELEDADVARRLMALVLGSQVAQSSGAFEGADATLLTNRTRLADPSILQTLTLLAASTVATNVLPMMLQLLCQLMFGNEPSRPPSMVSKVRLASVRLCEWTFHHTQLALLESLLGPVMFPTMLRLLMNPHTESEASSTTFVREFHQGVYESLTVLANRLPALVATSEQAFQVLLVRCLAEEEYRTSAGADALKTFTSFASAYASAATPEVRVKVIQELIALLNGSKLFEPSSNYSRVREAIAAWCAELLTASVPEQYDIALRFAVMRLESVPDENTRRLSDKALFTKPFPSTGVLARSLRATFSQNLTSSMPDVAVERCVQFCVEILKASQGSDTPDERNCVVDFITRTLLSSTERHGFVAAQSFSIVETAANALVEVCGFDAKSVSAIVPCQVIKLFDAASVSQDRIFLSNICAIVMCVCRAGALSVSQVVSDFIVVGTTRLKSRASEKELSGLLYILSSALNYISSDSLVDATSIDEMQLMLLCYQEMVDLLHIKVKEGSNFALYPRNELAQNENLALLRSILDGIGLSGPLTGFMRSSLGSEWSPLKTKTLQDLRLVVEWELKSVHLDDQLSPKLKAIKRVAIENLGRATSDLPGIISTELSSGVEDAVNVLMNLRMESDTELQFIVGEALVALGTHESGESFAMDSTTKYDTFTANRAATIFERVLANYAGSRQVEQRRNATVWLLCMCAAGLTTPSPGHGSVLVSAASWKSVFRSAAYSQSVLGVHEFFVAMLNDTNGVAKESAVKGLAYLRLRSPTDERGAKFSESLFRRLRCFRAFASTSDAVDDDENDVGDRAANASAAPTAPPSSLSPSTVENAAYREVSNIAADVGDPELMYALLYLSTNDPIWESLATIPTSAAVLQSGMFSFVTTDKLFRASIVAKAGSQWMADDYSKKTRLIPWLFLMKFHSNSKVAAVMGNLWDFAKGNSAVAATANGEKMLLRPNWVLLFQFVLARLETSRNFKYREAACLALVDLLNGAEADNLRDDFLRLWTTASRAVDDVMETVALAGIKLYRYLGETSLRVAASDAVCSSQLLEFLVADGIVSKNTICRMLSIDILLRLVKILKAFDIQNRLAPLLLKLLEYLSSLEMPELQYAQFHVEKKDQLERLRISMSQSGPVGQLLELARARLKDLAGSTACVSVVAELVRGLANLLKFGVGLNTRVGTANFVISLAVDLPYELRKCNGAELLLRRVLLPYVSSKTAAENDQYGDEESRYGSISSGLSADGSDSTFAATSLTDGLVIQSYCQAAAYLCPLVDATTVRDYVRSGIFAYNAANKYDSKTVGPLSRDTGNEEMEGTQPKSLNVYTSRFLLISALAMKELVKKVPPIADANTVVIDDLRNAWYCTHVFPAAFIGQFAATDALKSSWMTVLDELPPTILYSTRSLDAVLDAVALLLAHPAWDTRRQAARALQAIFASSTYRSKLSTEQVARIWNELIDAVPGRLWRGKGVILESIVSLAAVKLENKVTDIDDRKWTEKLSLLLVEECARAWINQDLAYLESAIVNLGKFSALLPAGQFDLRASNVRFLRSSFAEWMTGNEMELSESTRPPLPPLLMKCVFEALALMWPPLTATQDTTDSDNTKTDVETILWLCASVQSPHLAAWSVRRAIFQTLTAVVDRVSSLKRLVDRRSLAEHVIDTCCGLFGVGDAKYSMVRVAAAGTLVALLKRAVDNADLALKLIVQRERVSAAMETLLESKDAHEQQAAFNLKSQLVLMP